MNIQDNIRKPLEYKREPDYTQIKLCGNCKYYHETAKGEGIYYYNERCLHPSNLIYLHDYKEKWTKQISSPCRINVNNDCKNFIAEK